VLYGSQRLWAVQAYVSHVRDIEQSHRSADGHVFGNQSSGPAVGIRRILHRHIPAAKFHHTGAKFTVRRVECSLSDNNGFGVRGQVRNLWTGNHTATHRPVEPPKLTRGSQHKQSGQSGGFASQQASHRKALRRQIILVSFRPFKLEISKLHAEKMRVKVRAWPNVFSAVYVNWWKRSASVTGTAISAWEGTMYASSKTAATTAWSAAKPVTTFPKTHGSCDRSVLVPTLHSAGCPTFDAHAFGAAKVGSKMHGI
jgi:hypothetical protein